MNERIGRLGIALLVCFVALFVRLNQVQVFGAERLVEDPLNTRRIVRDFGEARGSIVTADGIVIAESVEIEGQLRRERRYPEGTLFGHITGFFAFDFGATGIEQTYNDELAGRTAGQQVDSFLDLFGDGDTSADVILTIDAGVQRAARDALGDRRGSVVAIDPSTGAVLALYSNPSFDPNAVSTTDLESARAAKAALDADPTNPLLARAYREVFFPGSTFKVVTAASALENDRLSATSPVFPEVVDYTAPLTSTPLQNFGGNLCGGDLGAILRQSCNTAFAQIGAEILGPDLLIDTAERFGFNDTPPIDLPASVASIFPDDYGAVLGESEFDPPAPIVENTPLLAQASIGQFDVRSSPLQMALVAGAIANEGRIMVPHLMGEVRDVDGGDRLDRADPEVWREAISTDTAETLRTLMIGVVESGTANALAIAGLEVGAKTGTAQTITGAGADDTHAWIIAFAGPPGAPPDIVVSVVVEAVPGGGQQTGGTTAAPIARAVLEAYTR